MIDLFSGGVGIVNWLLQSAAMKVLLFFSCSLSLFRKVVCFGLSQLSLQRTDRLRMSSSDFNKDLNLAARPTVEEWLDLCEPGLKRVTLGMFKACKEIAYKIRTASCDKMACFNQFGK